MEKNEIVELNIEDMSDEGLGIGHTKDGCAVFAKDTVIGDKVSARIVKTMKSYAFGRVEQVITPSRDRESPVCPVARSCGGCQIQEMSYPAQLRLKENKVRSNLQRIGGIKCVSFGEETTDMGRIPQGNGSADKGSSPVIFPVIGMDSPYHYRNKAVYPIGRNKAGRLIAGFYAGRTHTIIDCRNCAIGIEENQPILDAVLAWMERYRVPEYNETTGKGLIRHVMIRCGFASGQIMVVIVASGNRLPHEADLIFMLQKAGNAKKTDSTWESGKAREAGNSQTSGEKQNPSGASFPDKHLTGIILNTNTARTNVILGKKNRTLWGKDTIEDSIGKVRYQISPLSFYQVNPIQTRKLYETALSFAGLTGQETVWDLYCGIGTISLFLAQKAKMVYGVEVVPDAIGNAKENAILNGIDNAEFMCGKAEEVLPREYRERRIHADVIVVDPPRKGLETAVIDTIAAMKPERVVYVSCNSSTLARDLKLFGEKGYRTEKIQPVDMFPHSVHVECVALLVRKYETAKAFMNVNLDMDMYRKFKEEQK